MQQFGKAYIRFAQSLGSIGLFSIFLHMEHQLVCAYLYFCLAIWSGLNRFCSSAAHKWWKYSIICQQNPVMEIFHSHWENKWISEGFLFYTAQHSHANDTPMLQDTTTAVPCSAVLPWEEAPLNTTGMTSECTFTGLCYKSLLLCSDTHSRISQL